MNTSDKKTVIYVVGPTASGKTGLSIALAKELSATVICGDSMQIYKDMPIATAAPTNEEKQDVPHLMFEFLSPEESFSVSQYVNLAKKNISQLHSDGVLPMVVGGTGLYISSLSENILFGEETYDQGFRIKLEERMNQSGLASLYTELEKIDPESAAKISENDAKRILRALEVYYLTGETMTQRIINSRLEGEIYNNVFIGVTYKDREKLYERINKRVDLMVENGLVLEAEKYFGQGYKTSAQAIGHKELFPFFDGTASLEECIEHLKMQTRRYAKRQLTWFNKNKNIHWIYMDEEEDPLYRALEFIKARVR
ncbi:MAG: tRNA (adenosine(37)-N6)-dimethylallyltransferase MiaA [Clostridia bacterium]|nr:tRNA (adenosine(37)-N6)-dimethylallyltransferase MiaA [Clostridia bacterium]